MQSLCVCHCRHIKATQNKQHKRERDFFLVYWNGDEATRYTCTFFNKSLNFHAPQPYHSSAFSIIISLLFYSLFAVCLSACFFTVSDALSIAPPPPLPPFWHGTLSATNHRSDKKMRDEISSIMPKLSRWIWKKTASALSLNGQSLHGDLSTFTLQWCHLWFVQFPWNFCLLSITSMLNWFFQFALHSSICSSICYNWVSELFDWNVACDGEKGGSRDHGTA